MNIKKTHHQEKGFVEFKYSDQFNKLKKFKIPFKLLKKEEPTKAELLWIFKQFRLMCGHNHTK